MKRVAFARVMQETNALSPVPTTLRDFDGSHALAGDALMRAASEGPEVAGYFKRAELGGFVQAARARRAEIEPIPIISAWASSGGPLELACFEALEARLISGLRAAWPLDAVYLALHGAMGVRGVADPESRLLRSVRAAIGGVPLVVSHDLHGNLTRARVDACDALVAYHTNPHRDLARTGRRAGAIAIGMALGELDPVMAWRSLPMILGGGKTIDFLAPMRAVFRRMRRAEKAGEVLAASTLMVHPWNDDPAVGWSTLAIGDRDVRAADELADELAEMCWARRHELPPEFATPSEAIAQARRARVRRKLGCVMMADASDVVTAGAPGDSTHLLRALLRDGGGLLTYAAVRDPAAVGELWPRAIGDTVDLAIGGGLDPARSTPLPVRGAILGKYERHGFLRTIVLAVEAPAHRDRRGPGDGDAAVVLHRGRARSVARRRRGREELLPVPDVLPALQPQDAVRAHARRDRLRCRVLARVRRPGTSARCGRRLARARCAAPRAAHRRALDLTRRSVAQPSRTS